MKKVILSIAISTSIFATAFSQTNTASFHSDDDQIVAVVSKKERTPKKAKVVKVQHQKAEFQGGMRALASYLSHEVEYPEVARKMGTEGVVKVMFEVNTDGSIKNVKVLKSTSPELDVEAIRVIEAMPNWTPALRNGVAINSKVVVPVQFRLW